VERPNEGLDEHFVNFPHPAPQDAEGLYEGIAYRGDETVDTIEPYGPQKFRWRLYSTMLFRALLHERLHHPRRKLVVFNQSCLSAGHARFLHHAPFDAHFGTHSWPVLHISTAGPWEASISDYWALFLEEWTHALAVPAQRRTLGQVFRRAEERYYEKNRCVADHNRAVAERGESTPTHKPLSFGTVHLHHGGGMADLPVWDLLVEEELA
jgi:hypothetical protein